MVRELAADGIPVAVACRVLDVSTSGYYEWNSRGPSGRDLEQAYLMNAIVDAHAASHGTYGHRRIHAELVLGCRLQVSPRAGGATDEMHRAAGRAPPPAARLHPPRPRGDLGERPGPAQLPAGGAGPALRRRHYPAPHQARAGGTSLSCWTASPAASSAGRWPTTSAPRLVVDALQMAVWNRRPAPGAIHHSDHGSQYTSWAFGHRLREAGLLGSMGTIGDCFDNSVAESFFATLQTELLDRSTWATREQLANAAFAFIEGFYNPRRRHSTLGYLSPADYETAVLAGQPTQTAA